MIERSKFTDYFALNEAENKKKKSLKPRRGSRFERHRVARLMAVQAVFEANHTNVSYIHVTKTFLEYRFNNHNHPINPDRELFLHLMNTVEKRADQVREILEGVIVGSWTLESLDPVLKSILMVGIAELLEPYKEGSSAAVIISEYVEVAKGFFDDKQAGYINKALDSIVKNLRP